MPEQHFQLIGEVEPATRPDLMRVRHQIGVMSEIADEFLFVDGDRPRRARRPHRRNDS